MNNEQYNPIDQQPLDGEWQPKSDEDEPYTTQITQNIYVENMNVNLPSDANEAYQGSEQPRSGRIVVTT